MAKSISPRLRELFNEIKFTRRLRQFGLTLEESQEIYKKVKKMKEEKKTMTKLKPCPFCGSTKIVSEPLGSFGPVNETPVFQLWQIECECGGQFVQDSEQKTIDAWNRRTDGNENS